MEEKILFQGHPSHILFAGRYTVSFIIFALGVAAFAVLKNYQLYVFTACFVVSDTIFLSAIFKRIGLKYKITDQRITLREGLLSIKESDIELYRVKDIIVEMPISLRVMGLGHISFVTTDRSNPSIKLWGIKNPAGLKEDIRKFVEEIRRIKGVREID